MRRYIGLEVLAKSRLQTATSTSSDPTAITQEVTPTAITA